MNDAAPALTRPRQDLAATPIYDRLARDVDCAVAAAYQLREEPE